MGEIKNHADLEDRALARMAQQDPWIMYLVVRQRPEHHLGALIQAAAGACLSLIEQYSTHPAFAESIAAWSRLSFRKVVLRAKPAGWGRLVMGKGISFQADDEQVLCLSPMLKSERPREIARLQSFQAPAALEERTEPAAVQLELVVRRDLAMGSGKTIAQCAHAALMADAATWDALDLTRSWMAQGWPVSVRWCGLEEFELFVCGADCVVVRDAGLTEVAAGSRTVAARLVRREVPALAHSGREAPTPLK